MLLHKFNIRVFITSLVFFGFIITGLFVFVKTLERNVCANELSCEESFNFDISNNESGVFMGQKIMPPQIDIAEVRSEEKILGINTSNEDKRIEVDLTTQRLRAYEGDNLYMEARISSGKWFPTPTGEFRIWTKIRSAKMSGGEGADYYYLPNVPYIMFFNNNEIAAARGFALHGAYWHNNFGHAMSHGCVNLRIDDAKKLYYWADPYTSEGKSAPATENSRGTKIIIHGKAL